MLDLTCLKMDEWNSVLSEGQSLRSSGFGLGIKKAVILTRVSPSVLKPPLK